MPASALVETNAFSWGEARTLKGIFDFAGLLSRRRRL